MPSLNLGIRLAMQFGFGSILLQKYFGAMNRNFQNR
jgi:hypothetical protein